MSEQNKDLVRKYYDEVLNGRDLDAVGDYFADERIVEGVRRGCFAYFTAFPDLHCSLDGLVVVAHGGPVRLDGGTISLDQRLGRGDRSRECCRIA